MAVQPPDDDESLPGPLDVPGSPLNADSKKINIEGKDWLTIEEAAFYCRVSRSHFLAHADDYELVPRNFMGKKLYEKAELYRAIHGARLWPERSPRTSMLGRQTGGFQPNLSGQRIRPYKPRKAKPPISE